MNLYRLGFDDCVLSSGWFFGARGVRGPTIRDATNGDTGLFKMRFSSGYFIGFSEGFFALEGADRYDFRTFRIFFGMEGFREAGFLRIDFRRFIVAEYFTRFSCVT